MGLDDLVEIFGLCDFSISFRALIFSYSVKVTTVVSSLALVELKTVFLLRLYLLL